MEKDWVLKTLLFDTLPSTQVYLKERVKNKTIQLPVAVVSEIQTKGIGSRENSWTSKKGNLFLSFAIPIKDLPADLKIESASLYFSYLLQDSFNFFGSKAWLKWPNDIYVDKKKIAGMITTVVHDILICGVGVNLKHVSNSFGVLDLDIDKERILEYFFKNVEKKISWKQVFSKYKLNFYDKQKIFTHINDEIVSLDKAVLEDDGSLSINGQRIYSLR